MWFNFDPWKWCYFGGITLGFCFEVFSWASTREDGWLLMFVSLYFWAAVLGLIATRLPIAARPLFLGLGALPVTFMGVFFVVGALVGILYPFLIPPVALMLVGLALSDRSRSGAPQ